MGGFPPRLRVLLAAHNRVRKLSLGPAGAPALERLGCRHNSMRFVAPEVCKAPNLIELDLRDNLLPTAQLKHLAPLRKLKRLAVARNPLAEDRRARRPRRRGRSRGAW